MSAENNLTATQWADWIAEQVAIREKVYRTDPDELVSAYNREVSYARDYHGRELLELLQNADDAGVDYEHPNKVAIVLTPEGLCVANTGKPFSESGVKSLMVSDNSPKKNDRAQYIGNKGLGFRSILSWTSLPFILSGNLAVGFDSDKAHDLSPKNWTVCEVSIDPKGKILECRRASSPTSKSSPSCSRPRRAKSPSLKSAASTTSPKTPSTAGAPASVA